MLLLVNKFFLQVVQLREKKKFLENQINETTKKLRDARRRMKLQGGFEEETPNEYYIDTPTTTQ